MIITIAQCLTKKKNREDGRENLDDANKNADE